MRHVFLAIIEQLKVQFGRCIYMPKTLQINTPSAEYSLMESHNMNSSMEVTMSNMIFRPWKPANGK